MKLGRNAPCHCGSGKKYKTCCLRKDEEVSQAVLVLPDEPEGPVAPTLPVAKVPLPAKPELPPDPHIAALKARWEEFTASDYAGQIALFQQSLEEPELMDGEMAFEMLSKLFLATVTHNERERFDALVECLRTQLPEVYEEEEHYCLDWLMSNALIAGRYDRVPALANDLAALAGEEIDVWERVERQLAYHGQLTVLVEAMRRAWPAVHQSTDIVPWGIEEFTQRAINYEMLHYASHTPDPQADDADLLARLNLYNQELLPERLAAYLAHLTGRAQRRWSLDDFKFAPPRRRSRRDWDEADDDEDAEHTASHDPVIHNVHDLAVEFLGHLHRVEGVPYSRGDLGRRELVRFILQRRAGELEYTESMLESMERSMARRRGRKVKPMKKFQAYTNPLVPDHERLDRYLGTLLGPFNQLYYQAAAMFEYLPAWLRFLESRQLIDTALRVQTLREIEDLIEPLGRACGRFVDDPAPQQALVRWRENVVAGQELG